MEKSDNDRRRILKAVHAYKTHPTEHNLKRLGRYVKAASSNDVYICNVVSNLSESNSVRYSNFNQLFELTVNK